MSRVRSPPPAPVSRQPSRIPRERRLSKARTPRPARSLFSCRTRIVATPRTRHAPVRAMHRLRDKDITIRRGGDRGRSIVMDSGRTAQAIAGRDRDVVADERPASPSSHRRAGGKRRARDSPTTTSALTSTSPSRAFSFLPAFHSATDWSLLGPTGTQDPPRTERGEPLTLQASSPRRPASGP